MTTPSMLPQNVKPELYDISLVPDLDNFVFSGEEIIGGIYLDHRFVMLEVPAAAKDRLPAWTALCAVAIRLRAPAARLRGSRPNAVPAPPARGAEPALLRRGPRPPGRLARSRTRSRLADGTWARAGRASSRSRRSR